MTAPADGVVHYTCTRIVLIDALAALPLGGYLTLEARSRFADCILGQLPEAGMVTEERCREIMQATVADGVRPVIDAELAKSEAVIRADERKRIRREIDPAMLDKLADWFDTDDGFKVAMFPETWPERSHEVQDDLRRWAKVIRGELP